MQRDKFILCRNLIFVLFINWGQSAEEASCLDFDDDIVLLVMGARAPLW